MAKAIGIGGIFLQFKGDKEELFKWYHQHLGLEISEYGTGFIEGRQLVLLMFKRQSEEGVYINFRVDDIETLIHTFKQEGLKIVQELNYHDYGIFAQFEDPFGNVVELWEPNEENYKKMVLKEIELFKKTLK